MQPQDKKQAQKITNVSNQGTTTSNKSPQGIFGWLKDKVSWLVRRLLRFLARLAFISVPSLKFIWTTIIIAVCVGALANFLAAQVESKLNLQLIIPWINSNVPIAVIIKSLLISFAIFTFVVIVIVNFLDKEGYKNHKLKESPPVHLSDLIKVLNTISEKLENQLPSPDLQIDHSDSYLYTRMVGAAYRTTRIEYQQIAAEFPLKDVFIEPAFTPIYVSDIKRDLPNQSNGILGDTNAKEIKSLEKILSDDLRWDSPVAVLLGLRGTGKTTILRHLAEEMAKGYKDYLDLKAKETPPSPSEDDLLAQNDSATKNNSTAVLRVSRFQRLKEAFTKKTLTSTKQSNQKALGVQEEPSTSTKNEPSEPRIPLFLYLNEYAREIEQDDCTLDQYLYRFLSAKNEQFSHVVQSALLQGNCRVFFDGLDDISSQQRLLVMRRVYTFISEHTFSANTTKMFNQFFIAASPADYDPHPFVAYKHYQLSPLDRNNSKSFIEKWQSALKGQIPHAILDEQVLTDIEELPTLNKLASYPYFLACLIISLSVNDASLNKSYEVKHQLLTTLTKLVEEVLALSDPLIIAVLIRLAESRKKTNDTFSHEYFAQICKEVLKEQSHNHVHHAEEKNMIEHTLSSVLQSELFVFDGKQVYFSSIAFEDYFAARFLQTASSTQIKDYASQDHWQEALLLLAYQIQILSLPAKVDVDELLEILLHQICATSVINEETQKGILQAINIRNILTQPKTLTSPLLKAWVEASSKKIIEEESIVLFLQQLHIIASSPATLLLAEKLSDGSLPLTQKASAILLAIIYQKIPSVEPSIKELLQPYINLTSTMSVKASSLEDLRGELDHNKIHLILCNGFEKTRHISVLLALSSLSVFVTSFSDAQLELRRRVLKKQELIPIKDPSFSRLLKFTLEKTDAQYKDNQSQKESKNEVLEREE